MRGWRRCRSGVVYDVTDNETRRAAAEQRALADALATLATTHAEVIALIHSTSTRRGRR